MNAIRIRRRLDSETLHLPEINGLLGKMVEIIIIEEGGDGENPMKKDEFPLRGSVLRFEDPTEPVAEEDWEAAQ